QRLWELPSKLDQLRDLRVEQQRIEGEAERLQLGKAFAPGWIAHDSLRRTRRREWDIVVDRSREANPAEATARREVGLQHFAHTRPKSQVRMAHDPCTNARGAVMSAGAHGGDAVDELGLSHGLQRLGAIGPIHGAALDEYGGAHVVPTADVIEKLIEQIAVVA